MAEILDDSIDFTAYMAETEAKARVRRAVDYVPALKKRLRGRAKQRFLYLPWEKTRENFDFRGGETTIWAGQNGHGKSHVSRVVALSLMGQGDRVCVANLEAKPTVTLQAMARMYLGKNQFSPEFQSDSGIRAVEQLYDKFGAWTDGKLWLYDQMGTTDPQRVLGMAKYCAQELGIKQIFIDNLAKCVRDEDDYNGQKWFIEQVISIARDFDVHMHVMHHLKKPARETDKPDKGDVKGSGAIVDQPDNLMLVWRNKAKEEARKANKPDHQEEPDQVLFCRKQRNYEGTGDGEPTISLWLHRDSQQFVGSAHAGPLVFDQPYPHKPVPQYQSRDWEAA